MRRNNNGFSLVELIVVILITSILVVGASLAISSVHEADVSRGATRIENVFKLARQNALSQTTDEKSIYAVIYNDNGDIKVGAFIHENTSPISYLNFTSVHSTVCEVEKVVNDMASCTIESKDGSVSYNLTNDKDYVYFTFKRSTGGIGMTGSNLAESTVGNYYVHIILSGGKTENLYIVQETGRMYN